jgi:hypothetical protein
MEDWEGGSRPVRADVCGRLFCWRKHVGSIQQERLVERSYYCYRYYHHRCPRSYLSDRSAGPVHRSTHSGGVPASHG